MMWKARGDAGLGELTDRVMEIAQFCMETVANKPGFRLVSDCLQCPNVCFWYIPRWMREREEDAHWWDIMHKVNRVNSLCIININGVHVKYSNESQGGCI